MRTPGNLKSALLSLGHHHGTPTKQQLLAGRVQSGPAATPGSGSARLPRQGVAPGQDWSARPPSLPDPRRPCPLGLHQGGMGVWNAFSNQSASQKAASTSHAGHQCPLASTLITAREGKDSEPATQLRQSSLSATSHTSHTARSRCSPHRRIIAEWRCGPTVGPSTASRASDRRSGQSHHVTGSVTRRGRLTSSPVDDRRVGLAADMQYFIG